MNLLKKEGREEGGKEGRKGGRRGGREGRKREKAKKKKGHQIIFQWLWMNELPIHVFTNAKLRNNILGEKKVLVHC